MTPKRSGAMLIVVAVVAAVMFVTLLPTGGGVSLAAAIGLAAAVALAGLGAVWLSRTTWGPEPAPSGDTWDPDRRRRMAARGAFVQASVLLFLGATGAVTLVLFLHEYPGEIGRLSILAVLVVTSLVIGIASLRAIRASSRSASLEEPLPEAATETAAEPVAPGWVLVTARDAGTIALYSSVGVLGFGVLAWQAFSVLLGRDLGAIGTAIVLGVLVLAAILLWRWLLHQFPEVWVDVRARRLRAGTKEAPWSDITAARVSVARLVPGAPRTLFLTLEGTDKLTAPLVLRRGGRLGMTDDQRRAALALVEGAGIRLPRAREDAGGRFSRALFPAHVDAEEARELLTRPPRSDDDLPVKLV
ncbi:MAG: hypothetical protein PIR02_16750 [Microbacterium enclense]